jgi:hypothetical protein
MKSLVKIAIRLFLVLIVFQFINSFAASINNLIGWNAYNLMNQNSIGIIDTIGMSLPFVIVWCVYLAVVIILWIKSEMIASKIVGINQQENINITLGYEDILSVGLAILGFYLIIDSLPRIFSYISNFVISKSRFVDKDYLKEYTIKEIIEIIGIIVKMIVSFVIIKNKDDVVKKIGEINKSQP